MKIQSLFFIVFLLSVLSCKEALKQNHGISNINNPEAITEGDIDELFIEISLKDIATEINDTKSVSKELMRLCKIANYRFYSHVKIVDGYYLCTIKSGAEINVSESLFSEMLDALGNLNEQIKECRSNNMDVALVEISDDYLKSMLQ
ncbi:MAG: hypothetical protein ACTTIA_01875 [Candidatus Cryptobacteroides sp.]